MPLPAPRWLARAGASGGLPTDISAERVQALDAAGCKRGAQLAFAAKNPNPRSTRLAACCACMRVKGFGLKAGSRAKAA